MPKQAFDPRLAPSHGGFLYSELTGSQVGRHLKAVRVVLQITMVEYSLMEDARLHANLNQSEWIRRAIRTYLLDHEGAPAEPLSQLLSPEEIDAHSGRQTSKETFARLLKELGESVSDPKGLEALFNLKMMLLGTGTGSTKGGV